MSQDRQPLDQVRPHVHDGIAEYDNPLPRWWLYGFYATIVFAIAYLSYFHIGEGRSLNDELERDLALTKELEQKSAAATGDDLGAKLKDPAVIAAGKDAFATNCSPCHGAAGEGKIGPNLTDKYWLHGGRPEDIVRTIADGALEKGMPAWKPVLGPTKMVELAAYIMTLQGTNPPGAKEPQGEPYEGG